MSRYAAEIYRLRPDHQQVPLSPLCFHVDASAQVISTMVKRLNKSGYLIHEPYRGVRLTASGEKIPMPALRRYRLREVFLVKVMEYDQASAHVVSDKFERGINDELEDRMDELVGYPTQFPHGEPIPSKDGVMPIVKDGSLVDVPPDPNCIVSRVRTHDMDKLYYIPEIGLVSGTQFHLLGCAPFNRLLRLEIKPHDHIIGYELPQPLGVEVTKRGEENKLPPLKTAYRKSK